ncbi:hypothetical protein Srubr_75080 [Streptomyces rubradiris]|uniref:Uncharacterized protein n=1 Tax=Streptomyces rubradiris TaxID=285531 RepID=A0ABQ3RPF9_STRRR|nr:hypothetical protein GCM10018792_37110 [Streptomyces rubradiris]GHI57662.1 hypothetical protein Srubr_75080 [Streptomyces rubradiris]
MRVVRSSARERPDGSPFRADMKAAGRQGVWEIRTEASDQPLGPVRRGNAFTSRRGGTYGLWVTQSSSAGQRCAQSGGSVSL